MTSKSTAAKEFYLWRFRFLWWWDVTFGWLPKVWVNAYDPPSLWVIFAWGRFWVEYTHPWKDSE